MGLQAEGAPDALHAGRRDATLRRHHARTPMGRIARCAFKGLNNHRLRLCIRDGPGCAGARRVIKSIEPFRDKPLPPRRNRLFMDTQALRDNVVLKTFRASQHDPRPLGQTLSRCATGNQSLQSRPLRHIQRQWLSNPRHGNILRFQFRYIPIIRETSGSRH